MKCLLFISGILSVVLVAGSARAQDEIRFYDRAKKTEVAVKGTISEETPAQIVYKTSGGRTEKVSVFDVLDVQYKTRKSLEYRDALRKDDKVDQAKDEADRKKAGEAAIEAYKKLAEEIDDSKLAQRHIQFRLARLLARLAEDDPTQLDPAIQALQKFQTNHATAWQTSEAAKTVARLLEKKGDLAGAQKIYANLAGRKDIPKEVRQQADLLVCKALIDNNQHAAAEQKLQDLSKGLPADDPQALRVQVYLADCLSVSGKANDAEKQLQTIIGKATEPDVLALAYNTLGDCYRRQATPADLDKAFWQYLWVDVKYNQDRQEHARALYQLSKLFEQVRKDATRAGECRKRLVEDKQFAGSEYQKRAAKEDTK